MGTPNDRFEFHPQGQDNASAESRTRFSEQAMRPESVVSVKYASDPADRKLFRQSCAQLLNDFHNELSTANGDMRSANMLAENGQTGSQAYQQALQKAETSYKNAILDSTSHLFQTDNTGAPIRDANGNPKPGDLFTAINKERSALAQEMNNLSDMVKNGQTLTAKQMQDLDVTTSNPQDAIAQIKQQDMALEDLRRSAGYAAANFGLALMRNSEYSQGANKQQELSMAGSLLATAAKDDPYMLGHSNNPFQPASDADPNYLKSLDHVVQVANLSQSDLASMGARTDNTGTSNGGASEVTVNGQTMINDGHLLLPTGNVDVNSNGFTDPMSILQQQGMQNQPMSQAQIAQFEKAIQAADSIDRASLLKQMNQNQAIISQELSSNKQAAATFQAWNQLGHTTQQETAWLTQAANEFASKDQQSSQMIGNIAKFNDVQSLNNWLQQNKAAVQQFENTQVANPAGGQPITGADFISKVESNLNDEVQKTTLEKQLQQQDPALYNAVGQFNREQTLYNSSENIRYQYLGMLRGDSRNNTPQNQQRERQLTTELAQMDPQLMQNAAFKNAASQLGLSDAQLARPSISGGTPIDSTSTPVTDQSSAAQAGNANAALTAEQENSLPNAYNLFSQVESGKQTLTNETLTQLQGYLKSAQSINPAQLQAEANREYSTLLGQGWTSQMEQQYKQDNPQNLTLAQLQQSDAAAAQKLQTDFSNNQQLLQNRDAVAGNVQLLSNLQHAVPSIQGMIGTLLLDSGNAQQAQPYLDAAKGDQLAAQIPQVQAALQKLAQSVGTPGTTPGTAGKPGDASTTGGITPKTGTDNTSTGTAPTDNTNTSNAANNQNAGTPMGYAQQADQLLTQAVKTATASGDALANFNSAKPLFQQAMNAASQIDMTKVNQAQAQIGTQLQPLMQKLQSEAPNQRSAADMQQFQQLQQQAAAVAAIRQEPDVVAFRYASALNDVAVALANKGDKAQAKQYQDQAVAALQNIGKQDPQFGGSQQIQMAVNGAIEAAQKGQKFTETQAAALGVGQQADAAMKQGISPFGFRFLQPAETASNVVGSTLMEAGKIPGIGIIPAAFGSSLAFGDKAAMASAQAIAAAKEIDPATGKAIVKQHENSALASGFGTASDIVAGTGGLAIAEKVAPMALVKMGLADSGVAGVLATGLIGLTGTTGIRKTLDIAQHKIFGTPEMSTGQLLAHSTADFGAAWAIKGIANMKATAATKALNSAEGLSADGATITLKSGETVAADGKLTLNNGQVLDGASNRLKESYLNLPSSTQEKFDSAIAGRTNMTQQQMYDQLGKTVNSAQKDVAHTIFGRTNPARYQPFSFLRGADAKQLIASDAGSLAKPFVLSGKARLAYMAGGGAIGNSIFGLGNEDWSKPNVGQIGSDLLVNSATGAGAGVIGGVMAPWIAKFPLKQAQAIGGFVGKISDSEAGRVAMPAAKAFDSTGFWAMTGKATATRFGAGFGVGGTLGFVTHHPGSSESWKAAGEWGLAGGTALALGKPAWTTLDNYGIRPVKNIAQNALNLGIRAPLGRAVDAATSKVAGDGTFFGDQVTPRWNAARLGVRNFVDKSVSPWTAIYGAPFALQISDSANGLFSAYEWNKIGNLSDQIVAANAKAQQQQTTATDNSQAAAANANQSSDKGAATQPTDTSNNQTNPNNSTGTSSGSGTIGSMVNGG